MECVTDRRELSMIKLSLWLTCSTYNDPGEKRKKITKKLMCINYTTLLLLWTIRVLKSGVLVLASIGSTVMDRFILRMSTLSVTKIDGLSSVSDSGEREREWERGGRERRIASDEVWHTRKCAGSFLKKILQLTGSRVYFGWRQCRFYLRS